MTHKDCCRKITFSLIHRIVSAIGLSTTVMRWPTFRAALFRASRFFRVAPDPCTIPGSVAANRLEGGFFYV